MSNTVKNYVDHQMVKIPGGEIELRDDRIKTKWKVEINRSIWFLFFLGYTDKFTVRQVIT